MIFYVSEKIGHLFIVDWQSFLCEANLFFLRAGENEAVVHGTAFVGGNWAGVHGLGRCEFPGQTS